MSTDDRTPDHVDAAVRDAFRRQSSRIEAHVDARAGLEHIKEPSTMLRRNLIPALGAAAVVVLAISAIVLLRPFGGDEPVAGSTTTTDQAISTTTTTNATSTSTTSTTEAPSTTTTTTTTTTVPTPWDDGRYRVVNVATDDVLNVRQGPGVANPVVGTLPPGGLVTLDGYSATVDGSEWRSVALADGTIGWVNSAFLAAPAGWEVPFDTLPCQSDAAFGGTQSVAGDPAPGQRNALDVFTYRSAECDRFVIVLGSGPGLTGSGWSSTPSASVPDGTSVSSGGPIVAVDIPGVFSVRPVGQTVDADFGYVLATRDQPQSQDLASIVFRAFFDSNRRASIMALSDPGRIVIDVRTAPTGTGLDVAAKRSGTTVVLPIQIDVNGPGISMPITVSGWARPFEAQGVAILRRAASQPGTGSLVDATFSGGFTGTESTSSYGFMTADYTEAWGAFSFSIDDLAPGSYELFVGDYNMETGDPVGVYQTFTVAG